MSGNLYQLKTHAQPGQHVLIDGHHDRYGMVMAKRQSGFHLILGLGFEKPAATTIHIAESIK